MYKLIKRFLYCIVITISTIQYISAQSVNQPQIQSPNVKGFNTFGNIPVSYYTGIPNISIPLHSIKTGKLDIPISLRYHPGLVKPNSHPGWVGLGWSLESTGTITRVMHGEVDEANFNNTFYCNSGDAAVNGLGAWPSDNLIKESFTYPTYKDIQADEFFFNFFGHSGKFVFSNGEWQVFSDENIKVIFDNTQNGYVNSLGEILDNCTKGLASQFWNNSTSSSSPYLISRFFKGFTLITDDGTKYIFGGNNTSIEFTTTYDSNLGTTTASSHVMANAWHLTKIVDTNNNTIDFSYTRTDYPICSLGYYSQNKTGGCVFSWSESFQTMQSAISTHIHGGYIIFPVYLNEIKTRTETIKFKISVSNEKHYPQRYLYYSNDNDINNPQSNYTFFWLKHYTYPNSNAVFEDIRWMKLDTINICSNSGKSFKKYNFTYNNSNSERLNLSSIAELDDNNTSGQTYSFIYNQSQRLPDYGGDQTDHWGYYNGKSIENQLITESSFYTMKQPDTTYIKTELLSKIIYPTGGRTDFTWESNTYSKVVGPNRQSLKLYNDPDFNLSGYGAGVRIKRISSFNSLSSTTPEFSKTYYYVLNYAGDNIQNYSLTNSSGILNGIPLYSIPYLERKTINNQATCYMSFFMTNALSSYEYNSNGSPLGYSEVTEMNMDGSYIKYLYTNYLDYDGSEHYDQNAVHVTGWANGDVYAPSSSKECERGKLLKEMIYNNNKKLIRETKYTYTTDPNRFNKYIKRVLSTHEGYSTERYDALIFTASIKDYNYRYNCISKQQTIYDTNGENGISNTETYLYNSIDQTASIESSSSRDNKTITTLLKYTNDLKDIPPYSDMFKRNTLNPILIRETKVDNKTTQFEYNSYINSNDTHIPSVDYYYPLSTPGNTPELIKENTVYQNSLVLYYGESTLRKYFSYTPSQDMVMNYSISTYHYNPYGNYTNFGIATYSFAGVSGSMSNPGTNSGTISLKAGQTYLFEVQRENVNKIINATFSCKARQIDITTVVPKLYYDRYDSSYGNLLQFHKANDEINTSVIYSYNNSLPVIVAKNTNYELLNNVVNGLKSDLNSFTASLDDITTNNSTKNEWGIFNSNLRQDSRLLNAEITTYTYKPLVGMTSMTDPRGVTTYYGYDDFNRLKETYIMENGQKKLLQSFEYNYKH